MNNIVKLKSYRSFRIPVSDSDKISMQILKYNSKTVDYPSSAWKLSNVSLSGVAFESSLKFESDGVLELEFKFKGHTFHVCSKVARSIPNYNVFGEVESFIYGVEFFTEDQDNGKEFISSYISSFSTRRLKKHLINLLINESRINTFSDGQKLSLSLSLFLDMKQFKGIGDFLRVVFKECCRFSHSDIGNIYLLNMKKDSLYLYDMEKEEFHRYSGLENQVLANDILDQKSFKIIRSNGKLNLENFPSTPMSEDGVEFSSALYFPLLDSQGKCCGFFEFINFDKNKSFSERDLSAIELFSNVFTLCFGDLDKTEFVSHLEDNIGYVDNAKLIGRSKGIDVVDEFIHGQGAHVENVLIQGSNGVGKIHIGKSIHHRSATSNMPIGTLLCETIIDRADLELQLIGDEEHVGKLELYSGGSLIIHEPSALSKSCQDFLFETLSKRSDVRLITTTTKSLIDKCDNNLFSRDLYEFLSRNFISVPDLSERKEDIGPLVNHFLDLLCSQYGLPSKRVSNYVMRTFESYSWPGNIEELKVTIERLINYYPYLRYLDELPEKEFPIIGEYPRQSGIVKEVMLDATHELDLTAVKEGIITNYCKAHGLTREEYDNLYAKEEEITENQQLAS
ncbi:AAA-type ATPase lid domain-containing protein [Halobacteriovorax marinus]|uniref:sigma 54-interacting transcriptional regulator n=1 Tax=Halobacteriovorax marinus TaxID=97084 RepID=UPI000BDEFE2A|nr:sigma 54-interacting transcriptional regulator [Halobacteriovorax marinus]